MLKTKMHFLRVPTSQGKWLLVVFKKKVHSQVSGSLCILRCLDGIADAASMLSLTTILLQLFPEREAATYGACLGLWGIGASLVSFF